MPFREIILDGIHRRPKGNIHISQDPSIAEIT